MALSPPAFLLIGVGAYAQLKGEVFLPDVGAQPPQIGLPHRVCRIPK